MNGTEILTANEYFFEGKNVKNPKVNMPSPTRPNEWGKCVEMFFFGQFSWWGGAVIAREGRAKLEIGSSHCSVNTHSILMYMQLKGLSVVLQEKTNTTSDILSYRM